MTSALVTEIAEAARRSPAVAVGRPVTDTVKRCEKNLVVAETVPRDRLWTVQTPQAFQVKVLRGALNALGPRDEVTDDCQAVEMSGGQVKIVESHAPNVKITTPEDLQIASALLK